MIYLLDTNHCSRLLEDDVDVLSRATALHPLDDAIATNSIVCGELFFMAAFSARAAVNRARVEDLLERFHLLNIDDKTAAIYDVLKARLFTRFGPQGRGRGHATLAALGVSDNDAWIAASALQHSAILVSADRDFDRIREVEPSLQVVRWWTPPPPTPPPH